MQSSKAHTHTHTHSTEPYDPYKDEDFFPHISVAHHRILSLSISLSLSLGVCVLHKCISVNQFVNILWFYGGKSLSRTTTAAKTNRKNVYIIMLIQPARFSASSVCLGIERIDAISSSYHGGRRHCRRNNMHIQWIDRTMSSSSKKKNWNK